MTGKRGIWRDVVLTGAVTVLALLGLSSLLASGRTTNITASMARQSGPTETPEPATPTPTPEYPNPIYSESDAIARTTARFPNGSAPIARMMSHTTFSTVWVPSEGIATFNPASAVWVVGLTTSGYTTGQAVQELDIPGSQGDTSSISVDGIFIAWDANSGYEISEGTLKNGMPRSYSALSAIPNETIPVVPATPMP